MKRQWLRLLALLMAALVLALFLSPLVANIHFMDHACSGGCCPICKYLADQMKLSFALSCALPVLGSTGLFAVALRRLPPVARQRDMRAASPVEYKVRMND